MKRTLLGLCGGLLLSVLPIAAAQNGQAQQPKISEAQRQAILKVQTAAQAQDWPGVLKSATDLIENFPDTPYRQRVSYIAMQAANNSHSYDQTVVWGDRIIQSDPNDILARVQLADAIAEHTRENDLDKDQSLKKADDYAHKALELLQSATTPPANAPVDPAQWPAAKQQLIGQAQYALGMSAELKKDYPGAQKGFQAASEADAANPVYFARLSKADVENKQYDDAIAAAQKAMDSPQASPAVKTFAEQQKKLATDSKAANK